MDIAALWEVLYTGHKILARATLARARFIWTFFGVWFCVGKCFGVCCLASLRWIALRFFVWFCSKICFGRYALGFVFEQILMFYGCANEISVFSQLGNFVCYLLQYWRLLRLSPRSSKLRFSNREIDQSHHPFSRNWSRKRLAVVLS